MHDHTLHHLMYDFLAAQEHCSVDLHVRSLLSQ